MSQMLISITLSCDGERNNSSEVPDVTLPRKASSVNYTLPVPQTDTGSQDENSKVSERTLVKELGKNDPVTSGEGVLFRVHAQKSRSE